MCWYDEYLAINTKQLRFLIAKSKSTVNDALLKMGYSTVSFKGEPVSKLHEKIQFLSENHSESRKLSIRQIKSTNTINEVIDDYYKEDMNFLDEYLKTLDIFGTKEESNKNEIKVENEKNKSKDVNNEKFLNFSYNLDDFCFEFDNDTDSFLFEETCQSCATFEL